MKFLTDQDVYATTIRFLTGLGQDGRYRMRKLGQGTGP